MCVGVCGCVWVCGGGVGRAAAGGHARGRWGVDATVDLHTNCPGPAAPPPDGRVARLPHLSGEEDPDRHRLRRPSSRPRAPLALLLRPAVLLRGEHADVRACLREGRGGVGVGGGRVVLEQRLPRPPPSSCYSKDGRSRVFHRVAPYFLSLRPHLLSLRGVSTRIFAAQPIAAAVPEHSAVRGPLPAACLHAAESQDPPPLPRPLLCRRSLPRRPPPPRCVSRRILSQFQARHRQHHHQQQQQRPSIYPLCRTPRTRDHRHPRALTPRRATPARHSNRPAQS